MVTSQTVTVCDVDVGWLIRYIGSLTVMGAVTSTPSDLMDMSTDSIVTMAPTGAVWTTVTGSSNYHIEQ